MLNDNAKKWVAALESGGYDQTKGLLQRTAPDAEQQVGYCCLGVACKLAVEDGVDIKVEEDDGAVYFDGTRSVLPPAVSRWLNIDLYNDSGTYETADGQQTGLAEQNDEGLSFAEIAAIVKSEPKGLFA